MAILFNNNEGDFTKMDHKYLADLLFPNLTLTIDEVEEKYPVRELPEGAIVTRMAPSPTGFVQ